MSRHGAKPPRRALAIEIAKARPVNGPMDKPSCTGASAPPGVSSEILRGGVRPLRSPDRRTPGRRPDRSSTDAPRLAPGAPRPHHAARRRPGPRPRPPGSDRGVPVAGVDVRTVARAMENGEPPAARLGRRVLIPRLPLSAVLGVTAGWRGRAGGRAAGSSAAGPPPGVFRARATWPAKRRENRSVAATGGGRLPSDREDRRQAGRLWDSGPRC